MRILKYISSAICAIAAFITISMPLISSQIQGYYKGLLEDPAKASAAVLEKKQFWVQVGESHVFFYIFLICLTVFLAVVLADILLKKRRAKKGA